MADTTNTIMTPDVSSLREVDFVRQFQKNFDALLDVLSITYPIKRENGTELKVKTVTGTLQSGEVQEGQEIPVSKYKVQETKMGTIDLHKYAKQITLEAIKEDPNIVTLTDEEFCSDIQTKIQDDFYDMLQKGSLTTSGQSTFQAAIAKAIGLVKDKFKKMHRTPTGIAIWVNTVDLYDYLGTASIGLATQFGFEYAENFLGADKVFVSSEIPSGIVYATPLNNIKCYYVDPSDSDFAGNGLVYTKAGETGYVGFHTEPDYKTASTIMYAVCGIRLFAEYIDGIAQVTFGSKTVTIQTLGIKSVAGSTTGTTKLTVTPKLSSIDGGYYVESVDGTTVTAATAVTYGLDVSTKASFAKWDGSSDVKGTANKTITVVEVDSAGKAVAYGTVTAPTIK